MLVREDVLRAAGGAQLVDQRTEIERLALGLGLRLRRGALAPRSAGAGGYFATIQSSTAIDWR
jgi:hypothetical protein